MERGQFGTLARKSNRGLHQALDMNSPCGSVRRIAHRMEDALCDLGDIYEDVIKNPVSTMRDIQPPVR